MTPADRTRTHAPSPAEPPTGAFDPALDAGLAAAFGPDLTPGGWSRPPLLRDDPSDRDPVVQPSSPEVPRGGADRYHLLGEVARGGMGVVLKGRDPDLGRDLAVKVLRADLAGKPAAVQRFVEEAQVGGQLQHPGVVPVHDLGRLPDGRPYFAMKLVKGRTLADLLADRKDPGADRGRFLQAFLQVCQTVAYAHSRGVIHRDLKPSNVMAGSFGEVLVMDWGLAKVLPRGGVADEERAAAADRAARPPDVPDEPTVIRTARSGSGPGSETAAGSVLGTPAFMSPEQAGGEVDKLDERADVFGLGAILCVVLTGHPPYLGETGEAVRLMAVRGQLAGCLARLGGCGADPELVALCRRCLAAEPADRPRHAGEVADAVAAHLAGVEARARRAELDQAAAEARAEEEANTRRVAEGKAAEERRRRRAHLALAAAVLLLAGGGGAFGWWQDRQAADRRAKQARAAGERAADRAAAESRARQAVESAALLAAALRDKFRFAEAARALDQAAALVPPDAPADVRDRLDRARADLAFVRELDEVRISRIREYRRATPPVGPGYEAAFRARGLDPTGPDPDGVAGRVAASPVRRQLVIALGDWAWHIPNGPARDRLLDVLRRADPGPWSERLRDPELLRTDAFSPARTERLDRLVERADPADVPPHVVVQLFQLQVRPWAAGRPLLAAAAVRHPDDFWVQFEAGHYYLFKDPHPAAAAAHFRAALALRPDLPGAAVLLGWAVGGAGDRDAELACLRQATRIDPNDPQAHFLLGNALAARGDRDGAIACYREAIRVRPNDPEPHLLLGNALAAGGDRDAEIACYREAVRLNPHDRLFHIRLAHALEDRGDRDGAVAVAREGTRLNPTSAWAHAGLGLALGRAADADGMIASFREAVRLDPTDALAGC